MSLLGMQASEMHPRWGKLKVCGLVSACLEGKGLHRLPRSGHGGGGIERSVHACMPVC